MTANELSDARASRTSLTTTQIAELARLTSTDPAELWRASKERLNPFTNGKWTGLTSLMIGLVVVSLTYATEPISTTTAKASAELSAMLMAMPDAKNDCIYIVAVLGSAGPAQNHQSGMITTRA